MLQKLPKDVLLSLVYVTVGAGLGRGLAYFRSIAFARVVVPEQLGLYSLAFGAASLIVPFVLGGSTSLLVRYISYEGHLSFRLLWLALRRPLIVSILISLFLTIGSPVASTIIFGEPDYIILSHLTALILIGFTAFGLIVAAFQGQQRFDASVATDTIDSGISLLAGMLLASAIAPMAEWLLVGTALGFGGALLFALIIAPRILARRSSDKQLPEIATTELPEQEIKRFGSWMTYAAVAYVFVNWGLLNRWLLGRQVSYADAGRMYAVLTLLWLPFLLFQLVGTVLQPRMAAMYHQGERVQMRKLAQDMIRWGTLISLGLNLGISVIVYMTLPDLLGVDYVVSIGVIVTLSLSCYYHITLYLNSILAIAEGRARVVFIGNSVSAITNVMLSLLLVNSFGILGVTLSLAIAFFVGFTAISFINYQRGFQFFRGYWIINLTPIVIAIALLGLS